ncbi:MAG TPA: TIM barrel protein, partial [Candidatus Dormibacteraeota bacterium]|nr:TIM barrel protein [Candidatus Dormibacteraeota bacterium]
MPNPLALHTWTLDTTPLPRVLEIARETGWDAVELRRIDFARAKERGESPESVLDLVRRSGLATACVGVELGWMFATGDERARLLRAFDESCGWAKALGCRTVMSPVDRGRGEAARAAASVAEVGDIAARHGVRLALEFNS